MPTSWTRIPIAAFSTYFSQRSLEFRPFSSNASSRPPPTKNSLPSDSSSYSEGPVYPPGLSPQSELPQGRKCVFNLCFCFLLPALTLSFLSRFLWCVAESQKHNADEDLRDHLVPLHNFKEKNTARGGGEGLNCSQKMTNRICLPEAESRTCHDHK